MADRYIEQAIGSALSQIDANVEVVVVDDCSPDKTGAIADDLALLDRRIKVIHRKANLGVAHARNEGLRESDPARPFVLFLDDDDWLEPECVKTLHAALVGRPGAPAAYGEAHIVNEDGVSIQLPNTTALPDGLTREMLAIENCIRSPGAVLIWKKCLAKVERWDQTIAETSDWDMWFRLSERGSLAHTTKTVLQYRAHGLSMSRNGCDLRRAGVRMRRKWFASGDIYSRRLVLEGYERMCRRYARRDARRLIEDLRQFRLKDAIRCLPLLLRGGLKLVPGILRLILGGPFPVEGYEGRPIDKIRIGPDEPLLGAEDL